MQMHPPQTTLHPLPNLDNHPVGNDDDDDDGDDDNVGKKLGECGGGVIHYIQGAPLAHPPPTSSYCVKYRNIQCILYIYTHIYM